MIKIFYFMLFIDVYVRVLIKRMERVYNIYFFFFILLLEFIYDC